MRREAKWALGISGAMLLLGAFTVPLGGGPRTLSDHGRRILGSDEVQLLREDLGRSGQGAVTRARGLAQRAATPPAPPPSARFAPSLPARPAAPESPRRPPDPRTLPAPVAHPGPVVAAPTQRRPPGAPRAHTSGARTPRRTAPHGDGRTRTRAQVHPSHPGHPARPLASPLAVRAPAQGAGVVQSPPAAAARTHGAAPHR
ncbi:MAG: hypothetical protein HY909_16315 [Deltaproteobacteria bacterium]|nr:hypothetical protein [Deltaproteobacteria bacterium]